MNLLIGNERMTSSGVIGTSGKPIRVYWAHLVSGATASSLNLYLGSSTAGSAYLELDGVANTSVTLGLPGGCIFPTGCYALADANISYATIGYSEEC